MRTDKNLIVIDIDIKLSNERFLLSINKIEGIEMLKLKKIKLNMLIDLNF
tara:strand:- start:57 stop:206 length:150 start_codon:yes stop_codon:yes gene_type:complete